MVMNEKHLKLQVQAAINRELKVFRGGNYEVPPQEVVDGNEYHKLTRLQSDQGVVALVLACNLSGGSIGDMDLYKLVGTYLWSEQARAAINDVVKRHGL